MTPSPETKTMTDLMRNEIADIIGAKVSGPTLIDPEMREAHRLDQLAAADAILALVRPTPAADEVEAVARAIYLAMHGDKGGRWECVEPRYQDQVWGAYARAAIAAMQARSAEPAEDWEATYRYCVKQWEREREEMMRKVFDLRAQLGLRADGTPAEPAGEEPG